MSKDTASDALPPPSAPMVMPLLGEEETLVTSEAKNDAVGTRGVVEELKGHTQKKRKRKQWQQYGGGEGGGDTFVLDHCCTACFTGIVGFFEALFCLTLCEGCCGNGCGGCGCGCCDCW